MECHRHSETLELLLSNRQIAAQVVRAFTDEQFDNAAPVSLYGGSMLSAQFMLEDHAVRHSLHHLAKLRTALRQS